MVESNETPKVLACRVNGREVHLELTDGGCSLLDLLRDELGITSPKDGCQPQAQCGCCTVLVNGKPTLSCAVKAERIEGKSVTTLEGLSEGYRRMLAESFVRAGGVQCGFCIPGFAMRAFALCNRTADPSQEEITQAIKPHLCRCTGYEQIVDSIKLFARMRRGEVEDPREVEMARADFRVARPEIVVDAQTTPFADSGRATQQDSESSGRVGTNLPRYTGHDAVLGDRPFVADMTVPNMLYGALRLADHPRATVLAIDVAAALAMPGIHGVVTAADVPGQRYVGLIEQDWPVFVAIGEQTRCTGDVIGGVVAQTQRLAREAAARIDVQYRVHTPVTDPHAALDPQAPLVHPKRGTNLLSKSVLRRGDVDAAFAESTHVLEDTYRTQRVEHLFLEPEACIAVPENGISRPEDAATPPRVVNSRRSTNAEPSRLHIYSQGQGVFDDRRQIASVLGVDEDRLTVELVSNGGAFGGKEDMSIQAQTALMAWLAGRPVKVALTRPESFRIHPKRHPIELSYKIGCDAEGRITAVRARIIGDKGAYASVGAKVLERAGGHATGPYRVPNIDMESLAVYTNNPPCGAMRGFGANQAAFAIEGLLDRLARNVGIDGYDIRDRNILEPGDAFATGQILDKPFGLRKTLEAVKEQYKNANYAGIACGIKNVGIGNGMPDIGRAALTVEGAGTSEATRALPASGSLASGSQTSGSLAPGGSLASGSQASGSLASGSLTPTVHIRTGFTEMGQGLFTLCIQFAVEATGLPPDLFTVSTDTTLALDCGQTTASRATVLTGNSIAEAGRALRAELEAGKSLADLVGRVFHGEWICDYTSKLGADLDKPGGPKTHLTYGFATQVAILDEHGHLKKMIAAHDVGRVIHPVQLAGQIYGSLHMGIGYALTEDFAVKDGIILAENVNDCGVLRAHQMPEMELIFVEEEDPECPFGARGVGEIGLVPTAPAIAGALYRYDGIVRTSLPMRDSPAADGISPRGRKRSLNAQQMDAR